MIHAVLNPATITSWLVLAYAFAVLVVFERPRRSQGYSSGGWAKPRLAAGAWAILGAAEFILAGSAGWQGDRFNGTLFAVMGCFSFRFAHWWWVRQPGYWRNHRG